MTNFLFTVSIQCQAGKWWELRKISIRWLLLNPTPNSPNWHRKNCMAFSKRSWSERVKSLTINNNDDGYGKNNSDKWELTFTAVCRKVVGKMKKCMWQPLKVILVSSDQWILIETDKFWQMPTCMWIWEEQNNRILFFKIFFAQVTQNLFSLSFILFLLFIEIGLFFFHFSSGLESKVSLANKINLSNPLCVFLKLTFFQISLNTLKLFTLLLGVVALFLTTFLQTAVYITLIHC